MTDFVRRVLRPETPDWISRSLLDVDFYKFTMGYFIFRFYRGVKVTFRLINRNMNIPLAKIVSEEELRTQLDHARTNGLRKTDLYYLRGMDVYGMNMFSEEYLEFLATLRLPEYRLTRKGDQYELEFSGPWEVVTFWETIALAVITELYFRSLMRTMNASELGALYASAENKLYGELRTIKQFPWIRFADFGQRRRHSFLWQKKAVGMACDVLGEQFTGTSNTWMAFHHDRVPIGTNAHELPMVAVALKDKPEDMIAAQYEILAQWKDLYGRGLRIFLPDTFGSPQFLRNAPRWLAEEFRGSRQDSGDPVAFGHRLIGWYQKHGVNPKERLCLFSDGLSAKEIIRLGTFFKDDIGVGFGWGTLFTNGFADCHPRPNDIHPATGKTYGVLFRPWSLVCKVIEANGRSCVKLSDNIAKATGTPEAIACAAGVFGHTGRVNHEVLV